MRKRIVAPLLACRTSVAATGLVLVTLGILFHARYRITIVTGESMKPTLQSGNILIVDKQAFNRSKPNRGDLIVARYSGNWIVKRIVGLPGEEAEVRDGGLYINGQLVAENHQIMPGPLNVEKGTLMDGDFATLGDNRSIVSALAIHPIVTKAEILGKVVLFLDLPVGAANNRKNIEPGRPLSPPPSAHSDFPETTK
jgi:signal peptidase I